MSTPLKTKIEIIEETAAFYNSDNRGAANKGGCCYLNEDETKMCAVGRCLRDKETAKFFNEEFNYINHRTPLEENLKEEYLGHNYSFWASLQVFHDNEGNWDETGLSDTGAVAKEMLLAQWENQ